MKSPQFAKMPTKLRLKLANECDDLSSKSAFNHNIKDHRFHLVHSKDMKELTYTKMMVLFKLVMREMYEKSSWGWNEEEKMSEFTHAKTKTILVTQNQDEDNLIGFLNFRFAYGAGKDECVLYVYELHIHPDHQRQGLGKELMHMARVLASEFKMDKIMLTVFRSNEPALKFYQKLNFITDKSAPAKNEADYTILSIKIK